MIILDERLFGLETLLKEFFANSECQKPGFEMLFTDFDDATVTFCLLDNKDFTVQITWGCAKFFLENGSKAVVEKTFDGHELTFSDTGFTVLTKFESLPTDDKGKEALITKFVCIKRTLFSGPLLAIMNGDKAAREAMKPMQVEIKRGEYMWIVPKPDGSFICGFSSSISDKTDLPIAQVFYNEFNDSRRDAQLNACPSAMSSTTLPADLSPFQFSKVGIDGYYLFTVQPRHYKDEPVKDRIIGQLMMFRPYINYHFKCTKAFTHYRMRFCQEELVKVLNRAKGEVKMARGTKTISGRNMVMKK